MPGIGDPRFERAVIFLCAHDAEHAMGLTVNRPVEGLTIAELLTRLERRDRAIEPPEDLVLMGGPVERERGFVLHTDDYACGPGSVQVSAGLMLDRDARGAGGASPAGDGRPRRAVMALGYAGWGAGQLEREIRENVWLTCDADEEPDLRRRPRPQVGPGPGQDRRIAAESLSAQPGRA